MSIQPKMAYEVDSVIMLASASIAMVKRKITNRYLIRVSLDHLHSTMYIAKLLFMLEILEMKTMKMKAMESAMPLIAHKPGADHVMQKL